VNVDTTPDGFYAVCPIRRGDVAGFFWAAWWTTQGILSTPAPDAHGIVDARHLAYARAREAIVEAKGPRASILQLDSDMAVEAARIARPAAHGYRTGEADPPAATRPPLQTRHAWLATLNLSWPCTVTEVRKAYRRLARERHPDRGGTDSAFDALTKAYEAALVDLEMTHRR
jgi:hypothetical protein